MEKNELQKIADKKIRILAITVFFFIGLVLLVGVAMSISPNFGFLGILLPFVFITVILYQLSKWIRGPFLKNLAGIRKMSHEDRQKAIENLKQSAQIKDLSGPAGKTGPIEEKMVDIFDRKKNASVSFDPVLKGKISGILRLIGAVLLGFLAYLVFNLLV